MNTETLGINVVDFNSWLLCLPVEREFNFCSIHHCIFASFAREMYPALANKEIVCCDRYLHVKDEKGEESHYPLPDWFTVPMREILYRPDTKCGRIPVLTLLGNF